MDKSCTKVEQKLYKSCTNVVQKLYTLFIMYIHDVYTFAYFKQKKYYLFNILSSIFSIVFTNGIMKVEI